MTTVVLTTCANAFEANLIKGMLENNEITCFLTNENFSTLMPHYSGVMGAGIQIIIDEKDMPKAKELLLSQSKENVLVCPVCGSSNVSFGLGSDRIKKILSVLFSLLIWIPFGNIRSIYYCQDCKTEFKR
jgi:hypothetical protein